MCPKDANSVDWVYTICQDMAVQKLRIMYHGSFKV